MHSAVARQANGQRSHCPHAAMAARRMKLLMYHDASSSCVLTYSCWMSDRYGQPTADTTTIMADCPICVSWEKGRKRERQKRVGKKEVGGVIGLCGGPVKRDKHFMRRTQATFVGVWPRMFLFVLRGRSAPPFFLTFGHYTKKASKPKSFIPCCCVKKLHKWGGGWDDGQVFAQAQRREIKGEKREETIPKKTRPSRRCSHIRGRRRFQTRRPA